MFEPPAGTMSSVQAFREFINQRLTAAAAEIFTEFERTIVRYQEQMDRQSTWTPAGKSHGAENPLQPVSKEELIWNQEDPGEPPHCEEEQVWSHRRSSSLCQENVAPPQVKEEQEALCIPLQGEQHAVKQEAGVEPGSGVALKEGHQRSEGPCEAARGLACFRSDISSTCDIDEPPRNHTGETPDQETSAHLCETCGKTFRSSRYLLHHMTTHTGEKPFTCLTCGKKFSGPSTLSCHKRTHTGEKPYLCVTCGKRFSQVGGLKQHRRSHTGEKPYSCSVCGKSFQQQGGLTHHVRVHTGERPHQCETCGRRFIARTHMLVHIRTHTGEKPFVCTTCGKRFTQLGTLSKHKKRHTK